MPQNSSHRITGVPEGRIGGPVRIAQNGEPKQLPAGDSPAETATAAEEKTPPLGTVPEAGLLLYNSALIALAMIVFGIAAKRSLRKIPKGFANFAEWTVEGLNGFTVGIIGEGGEKYTPLIGTLYIYILAMNLLGLIPFFFSPSGNITFTLALGLCVFVYVQYTGVRNNGAGGHLLHFCGPMFETKYGNLPVAAFLMFPIEVISELFRPLTLAVRLFGNIFGEDVILLALASIGGISIATSWIPFHVPILLLAVLTSVVQALVFATLACIYIVLVSPHEEHALEDEGHAAEPHTGAAPHAAASS